MKNTPIHKSFVYIREGHILFARYGMDNEFHSHHAAAAVISIDSSFSIETGSMKKNFRAALITPDTYHRTLAGDQRVIVLLLDPEIPGYETFTSRHINDSIIELEHPGLDNLRTISGPLFRGADPDAAWEVYCGIMKIIDESFVTHTKPGMDCRVVKIADKIKKDMPGSINIEELSREVSLSGDRLIRLFREQTGLPLRRYLLWSRVRASAEYLKRGYSLTDAAHEAGFSDSAHMSRTFKENFGFTPSFFFGKGSDVEIIFCDKH